MNSVASPKLGFRNNAALVAGFATFIGVAFWLSSHPDVAGAPPSIRAALDTPACRFLPNGAACDRRISDVIDRECFIRSSGNLGGTNACFTTTADGMLQPRPWVKAMLVHYQRNNGTDME